MTRAFFRHHSRWLLLIILAFASLLRYSGNGWDSYQQLHPDERFLLMVTSSLKAPQSLGEYLDESRSPLNPRNTGNPFFAYGVLPTTLLRLSSLASGHNAIEHLAAIGRAMSATFDLGALLFIYLAAVRIYSDRRIALLAALLYGAAAAAIQQAHFFVVDPFLNFFLAAALYFAARYRRAPRAGTALAMGVSVGFALACKITAVFFVPLVAVILAFERPPGLSGRSRVIRAAMMFALFASMAGIVFRVFEPYAFASANPLNFAPASRWLANLQESSRLASGEIDVPPGLQWAGRMPLWFPWINLVLWGLAPAAGLTAWAGFGLALVRLLRKGRLVHLLPVMWVGGLFLYQGTRWPVTIRYFLPIYGTLCLLSAWFLVRWLPVWAQRRKPALQHAAKAAWVAVAAITCLWAVAFTTIYRTPHTRVAASEWIYANIPRGNAIACEHWDDGLPLRMYGLDPYGGLYKGVQLRWYDEETPKKLAEALDWLDQADWIILSSNRLYGAIPRVPTRYPMTTHYYKALFEGSLGFTQVREFTSFPRVGPLAVDTRNAEEAFTVYDHPVVTVFRKNSRYSRAQTEAILGNVDWGEVVRAPGVQLAKAPTALMVPADQWRRQLQAASWNEVFPPEALGATAPALVVLLFIYVIGSAAAPLLFAVCPGLPDRGYGLSKCIALLFVAWLAWLGASLGILAFTRGSILAVSALLLLCSVLAARGQSVEVAAFIRQRWLIIVASEAVFLVAFAMMAALRRGNPDLWHPFFGGEKPMDTAYLTAATRTEWFPLYGPWYSGSFVNYYYFGFTIVATLCKAAQIPPEVGYNVAIALLFAMAASAVFCCAHALLSSVQGEKPRTYTALGGAAGAVLAVLVLGNLKQAELFVTALARLSAGERVQSLGLADYWLAAVKGLAVFANRNWDTGLGGWTWYFDATRVFNYAPGEPVPITEFPYFTFSFGDLHAHLMSLPLMLVLIGLATAIALAPRMHRVAFGGLLAATALVWGALPAVSAWDAPAGAAIIAAALWLAWPRQSPNRPGIIGVAVCWTAVLVFGWLLYLPFHKWYAPGYGTFELWKGSRTELMPFVTVFGLFLLVILPLVHRLGCLRWPHIVGGAVLLGGAVAAGQAVTGLLAVALAITIRALWNERANVATALTLAFTALGLALVLVPEWLVLRGDVGRMNTVFKLGLQAWLLMGISGTVLLVRYFAEERGQRSSPFRFVWTRAIVAVLALSLVYPLTAPTFRGRDRADRSRGPDWNGLGYIEKATHGHCATQMTLRPDLGLIRWLRNNVKGTPVIAEFNTHPALYGWGNRMSNYTGLPAIVGWDWHLRQQMGWFESGRVERRIEDVKRIYAPGEPVDTWSLLDRYHAAYAIWGVLEEACAAPARSKFEAGAGRYWDVAWSDQAYRIYRIRARSEIIPGLQSMDQPLMKVGLGAGTLARPGSGQ